MAGKPDVETGEAYARNSYDCEERQSLLPSMSDATTTPVPSSSHKRDDISKRFSVLHLGLAFLAGVIASIVTQLFVCPGCCVHGRNDHSSSATQNSINVFAPPYVGSTQVHKFPPASLTNVKPTLFPSNVGYPGGTPTEAEPNVIETAPAYPIHLGAAQLIALITLGSEENKEKSFDLFRKYPITTTMTQPFLSLRPQLF